MTELSKIKDITKKLRDINKYIQIISRNGDDMAERLMEIGEESVVHLDEMLQLETELEQATNNLDFLSQIQRPLEQKQYELAGLLHRKTQTKTVSAPSHRTRRSGTKTRRKRITV